MIPNFQELLLSTIFICVFIAMILSLIKRNIKEIMFLFNYSKDDKQILNILKKMMSITVKLLIIASILGIIWLISLVIESVNT